MSNTLPIKGRPLGPGSERSLLLRVLLIRQVLSTTNANEAIKVEHRVGIAKSILGPRLRGRKDGDLDPPYIQYMVYLVSHVHFRERTTIQLSTGSFDRGEFTW